MTRKKSKVYSRVYATIYNGLKKHMIRNRRFSIGRSTSDPNTDIVLKSSLISRRHVEITWFDGRLFLKCLGKNGININGNHRKAGDILYRLPLRSTIRFPNTSIELEVHCQTKPSARSKRRPKHPTSPTDDHTGSPQHLSDVEETSTKQVDRVIPPISTNRRKQLLTSINSSKSLIVDKAVEVDSSAMTSNQGNLPQSVQILAPSSVIPDQSNETQLVWNVEAASAANYSFIAAAAATTSKPPYSFAQLIVQALASQPTRRLTLAGIYQFISQNYPYYRLEDKGWQNSVRHNLSLNKHFFKTPRLPDEPGKGSYWMIDPQYEERFISQAFRRRRYQEEQRSTSSPASIRAVAPVTRQFAFIGQPWRSGQLTRGASFAMVERPVCVSQTPTQINPVLSAQLVSQQPPGVTTTSTTTTNSTVPKRIVVLRHLPIVTTNNK